MVIVILAGVAYILMTPPEELAQKIREEVAPIFLKLIVAGMAAFLLYTWSRSTRRQKAYKTE